MPAYIASPFKPSPQLLVAGLPSYLWGSFNDRTGPTIGQVTLSKSNGTTTATLTFKIVSGNVPVNGSLITVVGSVNSANFNVTNVAIANVTKVNTPDDGTYTLTYAITSTATPTTFTADGAQLIIPQPEVGEALTAVASTPVALPSIPSINSQEHVVTVVVSFPSLPTSVVITLEQAVNDYDSEYATVATVATVSGGAVTAGGQITIDPIMGRFLRFKNGTVTGGTLPTIVAKLIG
jgi:hypothetical protein